MPEQSVVNETQKNKPLKPSPWQEEVMQLLQSITPEYSFGKWYYRAIYAITNSHNPERFAQAANSLRELLEQIAQTSPKHKKPVAPENFKQLRMEMENLMCQNAPVEPEKMLVQKKLIDKLDEYLELNKKPSRADLITSVLVALRLDGSSLEKQEIQNTVQSFKNLWDELQQIVHHQENGSEDILERFENLIVRMRNPSMVQSHKAI